MLIILNGTFRITNAPIDGQGTTSMRYAKWNLRWKLAKGTDASIWHYADSSVSTTKGWFDGASNHPKVSKITAKKNIASSSQGHKMGATKMYDDLYKELGLNHDLLPGARVSVYQYPVMGFQNMLMKVIHLLDCIQSALIKEILIHLAMIHLYSLNYYL